MRNAIILSLIIAFSFLILAKYMLEFRNVGLRVYIDEKRYTPSFNEFQNTYLGDPSNEQIQYSVDSNLLNISLLVATFPDIYNFLGWNLPFVAITKPIPRVFWSDKPTGLRVDMAESLGFQGFSISSTFIGESYISFGVWGVIIIGLILGVFCAWWNQLAFNIHSPLSLIIYTSGFYAVLITMRSLMIFTTALLPPIALLALAYIRYSHQKET